MSHLSCASGNQRYNQWSRIHGILNQANLRKTFVTAVMFVFLSRSGKAVKEVTIESIPDATWMKHCFWVKPKAILSCFDCAISEDKRNCFPWHQPLSCMYQHGEFLHFLATSFGRPAAWELLMWELRYHLKHVFWNIERFFRKTTELLFPLLRNWVSDGVRRTQLEFVASYWTKNKNLSLWKPEGFLLRGFDPLTALEICHFEV